MARSSRIIRRQISEVGTSPPRRAFGVFGMWLRDGVFRNQYFWNGLAIGKIEALSNHPNFCDPILSSSICLSNYLHLSVSRCRISTSSHSFCHLFHNTLPSLLPFIYKLYRSLPSNNLSTCQSFREIKN